MKWSSLAAATALRGTFKRKRNPARTAPFENSMFQIERMAALRDGGRPITAFLLLFRTHLNQCRLKNCTWRSWRSAASRESKVPRFRRLPVEGFLLREYRRYSPDLSFRIMTFDATFWSARLCVRPLTSQRSLWCEPLCARRRIVLKESGGARRHVSGAKSRASKPPGGLRAATPRVSRATAAAKRGHFRHVAPFHNRARPDGARDQRIFRGVAAAV